MASLAQYLGGNYNPKKGGPGGKVGKKDFSIDGKSWDFRDPSKHNNKHRWARSDRGINPNPSNTNAKERFNPLYDYDYGTVRDAAKELGIGNVDEKKEVKQIIDYIQGKNRNNNSAPKAQTQDQPVEYKPIGDMPTPVDNGLSRSNPLDGAPRTDRFTNDPSKDAIRAGDDLNDWYNKKFIPHLEAEANYGTELIGHDANYLLEKFTQGPYELGDVGKLYEKYKKDINKAAD